MKTEEVYRLWLEGKREYTEDGKLYVINGIAYETRRMRNRRPRRYRMLEVLCEGVRISHVLDFTVLH